MVKNHPRRKFLKAAGIAALSLCLSKYLWPESQKPNVIVMYIDDLDFSELGYCGAKALTPNIDKLAREGAILNRYYATSPVCTPSRYTALTGKFAGKCKQLQKDYPLDDPAFIRWNTFITSGETTIAHMLKKEGYNTGIVGKYHLFNNEKFQKKNPKNPQYGDHEVRQNLEYNYKAAQDEIKKTAGFDYVEAIYANNLHTLELPDELNYHNMDWVTEKAVNFINQNKSKPFYLYFATTVPHAPSAVDSMKQSPGITPKGYLEKEPDVQPSRKSVFKRVKQAGFDESTAQITWVDDAVGVVIDKLEKLGIRENTLIFFASDHGNDRGKMTLYEGGAKCPAFVNWKNHIKPNQQIDKLTANIDIVPTILDACNAGVPEDADLDGLSLLPLFKGKAKGWRKSLYLEVCYTRGIVTENWKYIAVRFPNNIQQKITPETERMFNQEGTMFSGNNPVGKKRARYNADKDFGYYYDRDQLYYLRKDPMEHVNLAYAYSYAPKTKEFQKLLIKYNKKFPHKFKVARTPDS